MNSLTIHNFLTKTILMPRCREQSFLQILMTQMVPSLDGLPMQELLHSLHGGDQQQIARRRALLKDMIEDTTLPTWQRGVLIHVRLEMHMHTHIPTTPGGLGAFSFPFGHAAENILGDSPDNIALHKDAYQGFVLSLFSSLKRTSNPRIGKPSTKMLKAILGSQIRFLDSNALLTKKLKGLLRMTCWL